MMDAATIRIRRVTPDDHSAILAITRAEFPAAASIDARIENMVGGVPWHVIKEHRVLREVTSHPDTCAVAECDGAVVGYITNAVDRVASRGTIANLAVTKAMQGRGIGRQLIQWGLALFRELGLQQAKIETLDCNEAGLHLYPKLGFREVVRQVHYVMPLCDSHGTGGSD